MKAILITLAITGTLLTTAGVFMISNNLKKETQVVNIYTNEIIPDEVTRSWNDWKSTYQKNYESSIDELKMLSNFHFNYIKVENTNNNPKFTFKLHLNKFADLTSEEFKKLYLMQDTPKFPKSNIKHLQEEPTPAKSKDWTLIGAVTDVKNQLKCGSCWAFSATGALEGLKYITSKNLTSFSEQALMDCSKDYGNESCNGGLPDYAFDYVKKVGIATEKAIPYQGMDSSCFVDPLFMELFKINGYVDVPYHDNEQLVAAIDKQPVSVGIDADFIMLYKNGVFNDWGCGVR